eukprot:scaffold154992_cov30-Tisochrysis_lutea.AAC.1
MLLCFAEAKAAEWLSLSLLLIPFSKELAEVGVGGDVWQAEALSQELLELHPPALHHKRVRTGEGDSPWERWRWLRWEGGLELAVEREEGGVAAADVPAEALAPHAQRVRREVPCRYARHAGELDVERRRAGARHPSVSPSLYLSLSLPLSPPDPFLSLFHRNQESISTLS